MAIQTAELHLAPRVRWRPFLFNLLPYLLVLVMTLIGVAYTSVNRKPLVQYWEILAVITCGVCIMSGWAHALTRNGRVRLLWTQFLHWGAFLFAMNLLLTANVQQMLNADATGLALLMLLALGTFVAGVHSLSWQTCALGALMALCVPAIAWIEESALIVLLAVIALAGLGALFWRFERHERLISAGVATAPQAHSYKGD
jgi:hypothetical protein